jgi:hypothetical protein
MVYVRGKRRRKRGSSSLRRNCHKCCEYFKFIFVVMYIDIFFVYTSPTLPLLIRLHVYFMYSFYLFNPCIYKIRYFVWVNEFPDGVVIARLFRVVIIRMKFHAYHICFGGKIILHVCICCKNWNAIRISSFCSIRVFTNDCRREWNIIFISSWLSIASEKN